MDLTVIESERQYQVTKNQIQKFEDALAQVQRQRFEEGTDDFLFQRISLDALFSQLEDLRTEARDYEQRTPT